MRETGLRLEKFVFEYDYKASQVQCKGDVLYTIPKSRVFDNGNRTCPFGIPYVTERISLAIVLRI